MNDYRNLLPILQTFYLTGQPQPPLHSSWESIRLKKIPARIQAAIAQHSSTSKEEGQ